MKASVVTALSPVPARVGAGALTCPAERSSAAASSHSASVSAIKQLKTEPAPPPKVAESYISSSMHFASTSRLGRVSDSGKVASGSSVTFSMSIKLGALALM